MTGLEAEAKDMTLNLFVPPGHYYSPIVDPLALGRHLQKAKFVANRPDCVTGVTIDREALVKNWLELVPLIRLSIFSENPTKDLHYGYINPSYSWGDGSILHAMLRRHEPKRFIEVGSGHSSACAFDTIDRCLSNRCHMTCIEPYPELLKSLLGNFSNDITILEDNVQEVPLAIFEELRPNDMLFIHSTHVLKTGSDVCFELFEILPRLHRGVFVHFHDAFWPFEYPSDWIMTDNRSWNELYALRAFLMHNSK